MTLAPEEKLFWDAYNTTTFLTIDSPNKSSLHFHMAFIVASIMFIYPVCLVLNNVQSKWYLPVLSVHLFTSVFSLINLFVFESSAPDLYPNNAYTKMSWILLFAIIGHYIIALVHYTNKWISMAGTPEIADFIPLNDFDYHDNEGSSSPSSTLFSQTQFASPSDSLDLTHPNQFEKDVEDGSLNKKLHTVSTSRLNSVFINLQKRFPAFFKVSSSTSCILFNCLNYPIFFFYLVYFPTGVSTVNLLGMGETVFNLLAHFIKGGVFFSLGMLYLSRYCGGFKEIGWSWAPTYISQNQINRSRWFKYSPKGMITMEMVESSLILFYGSTNIFLEHLAASGGEWAAKDLQHVSIAFLFIGCGLCGVLTEIKLSTWRFEKALEMAPDHINKSRVMKASPGYSPNPFPALTIFWTGILMSSHQQASELSTSIHVQWGNLLSYGSFFRIFTFILLMLLPNNSKVITKPMTELVTSFALLSGGLVFMESTDPVVLALEYRGFTSMFTLNLCLGIVTLIMAWQMILMALRDSLKRS